jgi:hypothetical protein
MILLCLCVIVMLFLIVLEIDQLIVHDVPTTNIIVLVGAVFALGVLAAAIFARAMVMS